MLSPSQERLLRWLCRIYGAMLLAYPSAFRHTYGREMAVVFRDRARDVVAHDGGWALLPFMLHIGWDWFHTTLRETAIIRKALTLGAEAFCLLAVDWLAFHDFREPHTVRDYLTLFASFLVFFHFGSELVGKENVTAIK